MRTKSNKNLSGGDWEKFLASLSHLDKQRHGEAVLQSAEGWELRLRIYVADRAGHMAVSGEIERRDIASVPRFSFQKILSDPTLLPQFFAEMTQVASR